MANILTNLRNTVIAGFILAFALIFAFYGNSNLAGNMHELFAHAAMRWLHVLFGIMWIGHLYYFNFTQIPTMPSIPDELKPGVSKFIAPKALYWFRWGAMFTLITGLLVAIGRGYLFDALSLGATSGFAAPQHTFIGIGMWLAIIMWFNVWFIIWPNQKIALGLVEAAAEAKPKAARTAMLFSRTNTLLSVPMLAAMAMSQTMFG